MHKEETHIPTSRDVDLMERYRPNEIMNYLADLARRHAEEIGFGYEAMRKKNLFWAVHQYRIHIVKAPRISQNLTCSTRAWFRKGFRADRQFKMSLDGKDIVQAHTRWILINYDTRRPEPVTRHFEESGEPMIEASVLAAMESLETGSQFGSHLVNYSDVDVHQHCNNSRYLSWCIDQIPVEVWKKRFVQDLQIEFHKECFAGETIDLFRNGDADFMRFDGFRDGEKIFTLHLTFADQDGL